MAFTTFKAGDYKDNKNTLNKKMIQSFGIFLLSICWYIIFQ